MARSFRLVGDQEARTLLGHGFSTVGGGLKCPACGADIASASDIEGGPSNPSCVACNYPLEAEQVKFLFRRRKKANRARREARRQRDMEHYFADALGMGDGTAQ